MSEKVYVVGAGPAGLLSAIAVAKQHHNVQVSVFEHYISASPTALESLPVLLHKQGKQALASMDVIVGTVQVETCLQAAGNIVSAHDLFGEDPEVLTWKDLMDGLIAKVNSLPNITMHRGSVVSKIDLAQRKMLVTENSTGYTNPHSAYDLPKLLVLAEFCEDVMKQVTDEDITFSSVSDNDSGLAIVALSKVPVDGEGDIQVYTKGDTGLVLVKEVDVAVLATSASNESALRDEAKVRELLLDIGAPTSVVTAVTKDLAAAKSFKTSSGSTNRVGITTKAGDAVVLVGPAAFRTDAPLCLDVNAGLHSALLMAKHVAAKGVDGYNSAFAKEATDLVKASRPGELKRQVTLENALGLERSNSSRIRDKCMGTNAGGPIQKLAMLPVQAVNTVFVQPAAALFRLLSNRRN